MARKLGTKLTKGERKSKSAWERLLKLREELASIAKVLDLNPIELSQALIPLPVHPAEGVSDRIMGDAAPGRRAASEAANVFAAEQQEPVNQEQGPLDYVLRFLQDQKAINDHLIKKVSEAEEMVKSYAPAFEDIGKRIFKLERQMRNHSHNQNGNTVIPLNG